MELQPLLPWWLLVGVVLCAGSVALWSYRQRPVMTVLRLATIAVLTLMLANPVTTVVSPIMVKPTIALVIDASGSMATTDCTNDQSRIECARQGMHALAAMIPDATISWYGLRRTLTSGVPDKADGDTDFSALTDLTQLTPKPQAVVLASDGADWVGSDPEDDLDKAGVIMHTVGVGGRKAVENLAVNLSSGSPTVFLNQEVPLQVSISATPGLCGRMLPLTIEEVADDGSAHVVAKQDVLISQSQRITIPMAVGDALGARLWRASLPVLPNEIRADDNISYASAQVVYRALHIQVLEGRPWWDTACAVRAWRRDMQLEVATSYHLGAHTRQDGAPFPRPILASTLAKLDVLVLGMECHLSADESQTVQNWVNGGGSLILLGAVATDPGLESIDPLDRHTDRFQISASILDNHDGALIHGDDSVTLIGKEADLRPQSQLLLGTRHTPLVARRHFGSGLVLAVNCEGIWHWELGRSGRAAGETFWMQVIRELVIVPKGTLQSDRQQYLLGEDATIRIPLAETGSVQVQPPHGPPIAVAPDGSVATLHLDQLGCWRLQLGKDHLVLVVQKEAREMTEIGRNDSRLKRMADRTNGEMVDIADINTLAAHLKARQALAGESSHTEPLVTSHWWFLAVTLLLTSEWLVRRRFWSML